MWGKWSKREDGFWQGILFRTWMVQGLCILHRLMARTIMGFVRKTGWGLLMFWTNMGITCLRRQRNCMNLACATLMSGELKSGRGISLSRSVLRKKGLFGRLSISSTNIRSTRVRNSELCIGRSRAGSLMCRIKRH